MVNERMTLGDLIWKADFIRKPRLVLGLMPPDLNRKSISLLLTAAGREKLLISDADLCKSRICLRSTCLFDLNSHLRHLCMHCCCLLLNPDCYFFSRKIQSAGLTRLGGRLNSAGRSTQLGWEVN